MPHQHLQGGGGAWGGRALPAGGLGEAGEGWMGLTEGAVARRRWWAAVVALWRAGEARGVARPESTSGRKGFRSGVNLGCCGEEEGGRRGGPRGGGNGGEGEAWGASAGMRNIWI